jgi:hypothetical protein
MYGLASPLQGALKVRATVDNAAAISDLVILDVLVTVSVASPVLSVSGAAPNPKTTTATVKVSDPDTGTGIPDVRVYAGSHRGGLWVTGSGPTGANGTITLTVAAQPPPSGLDKIWVVVTPEGTEKSPVWTTVEVKN